MIYIIGIGLENPNDITLKGLEAIKRCDYIYVDVYTNKLTYPIKDLEDFIDKKIIIARRDLVENSSEILENAKKYDVALLVIGDVFAATTHVSLYLDALKNGIEVEIIHNVSILNAISDIGLSLYNLGKTTSIPFNHNDVKTPIEVIKQNLSINAHTLVLLDIDTENDRYLSINEALDYLVRNGLSESLKVIAISQLRDVKYDAILNLKKIKFTKFPQSIIVPGKLHFMEEEALLRLHYD